MNDSSLHASINKHVTLPTGWVQTKLSDVCEEVQKVDPASIYKREFIYVDIGSIDNDAKIISNSKKILVSEAPSRARQLIRGGDVLFSTVRTYLKNIAAVPEQLDGQIASTGFCVLRGRAGIVGRYLYWYCLGDEFVNRLTPVQRGTSYPAVRDEDVKGQFIPIPPLHEQDRIVAKIDELFSELDAGVASLKRARALLKKYRQSVLKAAVTGELTRDWRERHKGQIEESGANLLQRILKARREAWEAAELKKLRAKGKSPKDDRWKQKYKEPQHNAIGAAEPFALPDTWTWATVDELATLVQYGTSAKCQEEGWSVPVLRMGNIVDGSLDFSNLKFLPANHHEFPELLLEPSDILFNRTNSAELVGKSAVYNGPFNRCSFASYLIRVRVIGIRPEFLTAFINSAFGRAWVGSVVSQQVGQANVNGSKLRALKVPLPTEEEQEEILQRLDQAMTEAEALDSAAHSELRRSESIRQSILKAAFAGKLVPQDPNDEPASVLLERIRAERAARPKPARGRRRMAGPRQLALLR